MSTTADGRSIHGAWWRRAMTLVAWSLWGLAFPARAEGSPSAEPPPLVANLSLEQLSQIKILSVSKHQESLTGIPAAVHVITADEIRRSGALTIPEALRLAPGVDVGQIGSSEWAVSIRGFNFRFANKLLVLVDGREVYSPLFSGTRWDVQGLLPGDIDRIEVVRGPGGTVWGVNAVNGVINIVTKPTADTVGTSIIGGSGSLRETEAAVRQGWRLSDELSLRLNGSYDRQAEVSGLNGRAGSDAWTLGRGGLRLDWIPADDSEISVEGGGYAGRTDFVGEDLRGAHAKGLWTRDFSESSALRLQAFYNYDERDPLATSVGERRHTFDVDFHHRLALASRHEVTWGMGYRFNENTITASSQWVIHIPRTETHLVTGFLQEEFSVVPDRLLLTAGAKLSHDEFVEWEVQPSARLAWTPGDKHTIWAAVTRAVRSPGELEGERMALQTIVSVPPTVRPGVLVTSQGSPDTEAEKVLSYELGYRVVPLPWLSLDLAAFYNSYSDLLYAVPVASTFNPLPAPGLTRIEWEKRNWTKGESYGAEASVTVQPMDAWRLSLAYSFLQVQLHPDGPAHDATDEGTAPHHQVSLLSSVIFSEHWDFSSWFRYVGAVPGYRIPATHGVRAYVALDLAATWRPHRRVSLSLVGKNLLDSRHAEFLGPGRTEALEIPRSIFGKVSWQF